MASRGQPSGAASRTRSSLASEYCLQVVWLTHDPAGDVPDLDLGGRLVSEAGADGVQVAAHHKGAAAIAGGPDLGDQTGGVRAILVPSPVQMLLEAVEQVPRQVVLPNSSSRLFALRNRRARGLLHLQLPPRSGHRVLGVAQPLDGGIPPPGADHQAPDLVSQHRGLGRRMSSEPPSVPSGLVGAEPAGGQVDVDPVRPLL